MQMKLELIIEKAADAHLGRARQILLVCAREHYFDNLPNWAHMIPGSKLIL